MQYLHFALLLKTIINLCSALKFRTLYLCLYQVMTSELIKKSFIEKNVEVTTCNQKVRLVKEI